MTITDRTIGAIAVAFELCGTVLSEAAITMIVEALSDYSDSEITVSLKACLREVKGKLALSDIIQRIPKKANMRPAADDAFSRLPRSEHQSVVWTVEMATAYGQVAELLAGDPLGARMAFREAYNRLVDIAESKGVPVKWEFSGGTDKSHREVVLKNAMDNGLLEPEYAKKLLPEKEVPLDDHLLTGEIVNMSEYINKLKEQMGTKF